jgi:hypothetical protein
MKIDFIRITVILFFLTIPVCTFCADQNNFRLGPAPQLTEEEAQNLIRYEKAAQPGLVVDIKNRADVVAFFETYYEGSAGVNPNWTGDVDNCIAGDTDQAFKDSVLTRVNYYRAMAGMPGNVVFNTIFNQRCQEAALMMIAEGSLSHFPGTDWACYSEEGKTAAGKSNLSLGSYGVRAIDGQMEDFGDFNISVGHRRWILFPRAAEMGTGDTTHRNGFFNGSNSLYVIGTFGPQPEGVMETAWPPAGYVPQQVVFLRWSFAYPDADFTQAEVVMTKEGSSVSNSIIYRDSPNNDVRPEILVWEPEGLPGSPPSQDIVFNVTINNVLISGQPESFNYQVTVIDPDRVVVEPTPTPKVSEDVEEMFETGKTWNPDGSGEPDHEAIYQMIRDWRD